MADYTVTMSLSVIITGAESEADAERLAADVVYRGIGPECEVVDPTAERITFAVCDRCGREVRPRDFGPTIDGRSLVRWADTHSMRTFCYRGQYHTVNGSALPPDITD